jgi:hypothetical protein
MVVLNPVSAVLGVAQLGMGIAGAFGDQQKHIDQVRQGTFSNALSRRKTQMMNEYRQRAYGRQVDFAKMQQEFNADAASRAYVSEQIRFNEQMAEFAFNNVNFQKNLTEEMGKAAAGERYGKSAQRMAAVETLGQYGRNQAVLAKSLASASRQSEANLADISRKQFQADYQVYGSIMEGPLMEMAEPTFQPGRAPNMALAIGGAALGATQSFFAGSYTKDGTTKIPFM